MKQIRLLLVGAAALTLWGCSSGGGSAPVGTTGNPLASGRAALNNMASGIQPTSSQSLQSALDLFLQATQKDPNSSEAHWGAAVCMAGLIAQDVDGNVSTSSKAATQARTRSDPGDYPPPPPPPNGGSGNSGSSGSGSSGSGSTGPGSTGPGKPTLPPAPSTGDYPPAPPGHTDPVKPVEKHHVLGLFWNLDHGLSNPYSLLHMLAPISDLRVGFLPYMGYPQDSQSVARRQDMLTKLGTVLDNLHKVEADPNFSTTLPDPDWNGKPVTIGLPEVYLFDAYVNSLRTEIALSLAYVRDPGNWQPVPQPVGGGTGSAGGGVEMPPAPPIFTNASKKSSEPSIGIAFNSPYAALDANKDGKLTPGEYLPPSPYLTLRDASYLQTAQQSMLAVVDAEGKGIAGVLARPADGTFLIPNTTEVQAVLKNIRDNVLPVVQQAANGPITLDIPHYQPMPMTIGGGTVVPMQGKNDTVFMLYPVGVDLPPSPPVVTTEKLTINLAAWFKNPPQDLKVFAPTYVLNTDGWVDFTKTTYPDLTFAGLFPNGLPEDLRL